MMAVEWATGRNVLWMMTDWNEDENDRVCGVDERTERMMLSLFFWNEKRSQRENIAT